MLKKVGGILKQLLIGYMNMHVHDRMVWVRIIVLPVEHHIYCIAADSLYHSQIICQSSSQSQSVIITITDNSHYREEM